jgi:hypothetical protein
MEEKKLKYRDTKPAPRYNEPEMELHLVSYSAVGKFKSVRRAIRKSYVSQWGDIVPRRPFNNSKRTRGRKQELVKERLYGQIRHKFETAHLS